MDKLTEVLGTWEGYRLGTVQRFAAGERSESAQVWLELLPDPGRSRICDGCGEAVEAERVLERVGDVLLRHELVELHGAVLPRRHEVSLRGCHDAEGWEAPHGRGA